MPHNACPVEHIAVARSPRWLARLRECVIEMPSGNPGSTGNHLSVGYWQSSGEAFRSGLSYMNAIYRPTSNVNDITVLRRNRKTVPKTVVFWHLTKKATVGKDYAELGVESAIEVC